jgi:hypothetical protein
MLLRSTAISQSASLLDTVVPPVYVFITVLCRQPTEIIKIRGMKILVILDEKKHEVENIRGLNLAGNKGLSRRCLQYKLKSLRHNLLYKAWTDIRLELVYVFTSVSSSWADTGDRAF